MNHKSGATSLVASATFAKTAESFCEKIRPIVISVRAVAKPVGAGAMSGASGAVVGRIRAPTLGLRALLSALLFGGENYRGECAPRKQLLGCAIRASERATLCQVIELVAVGLVDDRRSEAGCAGEGASHTGAGMDCFDSQRLGRPPDHRAVHPRTPGRFLTRVAGVRCPVAGRTMHGDKRRSLDPYDGLSVGDEAQKIATTPGTEDRSRSRAAT